MTKLSNEEVVVKVIHGGVGAINESDVSLASASNAIIIGFNVRPDATAKSIAEREKVDVRLYKVIYQAIEDVEAAMKGMLDPVFEEKVIGHAVSPSAVQGFRCWYHRRFLCTGRQVPERLQLPYYQRGRADLRRTFSILKTFQGRCKGSCCRI